MSKSLRDRLSQVLLEKKIVTEKDLKRATEIHDKEGGSFGWILVREGIVTEKDLMSVMSNAFNVPVVNLSRYKIEKEWNNNQNSVRPCKKSKTKRYARYDQI